MVSSLGFRGLHFPPCGNSKTEIQDPGPGTRDSRLLRAASTGQSMTINREKIREQDLLLA